jgi:alkyl sulfatase BDS1-like metallo-beta-lactamase superfamily hydrolase|tara:strand:+ start:184 stop:1797 length:1614 start_codon:yes stop_codon:yes gene_type:complete
MSNDLRKNVAIFGEPQLIKVTDKVYLAFAFDLVNSVFVIGDDGVVIIDTLARVENAERALVELRKITDKPIVAIIYSHGHFDHTAGSAAFIPSGNNEGIPVYASDNWKRYREELVSPLYPMINRRMIEQVGFAVSNPDSERYEHVLGPVYPKSVTQSYVTPNHTISGHTKITLAGVKFEIIPIPSEMDDEMIIWLPEEGVAYAADTMALLYPFLATPRSEPSRSPRGFIKAKDIMLDWQAEHLLLGHGPPVSGTNTVKSVITNYRDVEQTLLDQTIAAINNGMTRNEAAAQVSLPAHLASDPNLIDSYHRASWVIKGLYSKLSGWFGNDAMELIQHTPKEEAYRMISLAGGADNILDQAQISLDEGDYSWAAQLATYMIQADKKIDEATKIKIKAFTSLASITHSANERYYLLSGALWLEQGGVIVPGFNQADHADMVPTVEFLELLGPRLDPIRSADTNLSVNISITDTNEYFRLTVRRGVLERRFGKHQNPDLKLSMKRKTLLEFTARLTPVNTLISNGDIQSSGDISQLLNLIN